MKRYDLMIPKGLKIGEANAIALVAEYDRGIEDGILHFSPVTKELLPDPGAILKEIDAGQCVIVWGRPMGYGVLGMQTFVTGEDGNIAVKTILTAMHPEILKKLPPLKSEEKE